MDAKINEGLSKLTRPLESLKLDDKNARSHSERNVKLIADSLERFGQQKPIVVDKDGVIIAGNGTWLAAKGLGWKAIAAVHFDGKDAALRKAFALMDNRTAELAEWDASMLQSELARLESEGIHAQEVGFDPGELELMFRRLDAKPPEEFPDYGEGSVETNIACPKCGYEWRKGQDQ